MLTSIELTRVELVKYPRETGAFLVFYRRDSDDKSDLGEKRDLNPRPSVPQTDALTN